MSTSKQSQAAARRRGELHRADGDRRVAQAMGARRHDKGTKGTLRMTPRQHDEETARVQIAAGDRSYGRRLNKPLQAIGGEQSGR